MPDAEHSQAEPASYEAVLDFWFEGSTADEASMRALSARWFSSDAAMDRAIAARFADTHAAAMRGALDHWGGRARSRLALIVVLDQFSRNILRGDARAFAGDARALELTLDGIEGGMDRELSVLERVFFYMPLQHAEHRDAQALSVRVFRELAGVDAPAHVRRALAGFAEFAEAHRDIVDRFGRFPHRNEALGRPPTGEERAFLSGGGPSFGQRPHQ